MQDTSVARVVHAMPSCISHSLILQSAI